MTATEKSQNNTPAPTNHIYTDLDDTVEIRQWVSKGGGMMVNTSALNIDDPDHAYNQIKSQGKNPEDYGIDHPYVEEFKDKSRGDLISEILELRKEVMALHRASAAGWI